MKVYEKLLETKDFLNNEVHPKVAFVLGSGLSFFGDSVEVHKRWKFSEIPHFCPPTVEGHPGQLLLGQLEGLPVAILQGRIHAFEGHSFQEIVYPVRTLAMLGVKILNVTNAAGGLNPKMKPGDLMIIKDQMNLTGNNPLIGPNIDELGPRFPDMTDLYDSRLRALLKKALVKHKARHSEGVYCGLLGPTYETAAEIRYLSKIGGHAVGMSTVSEVIAARHAGLRVAGLSCITNLGTGLSKSKLSHDEVKETAQKVERVFSSVLKTYTKLLASTLT